MDFNKHRPREKVLVLVHHNEHGPYIEVFGEKHVDVHIRNVPYSGTRRGEAIADNFIEQTLERPYRDLHWPGNVRAHAPVRIVKPSDIVNAIAYRDLIRGLDGIAQKPPRRRAS